MPLKQLRENAMENEKEDQIRRRAYEIWESEERPVGEDIRHWLQAYEELRYPNAPGEQRLDSPDEPTASEPKANADLTEFRELEITTGEKPAALEVKRTEGP